MSKPISRSSPLTAPVIGKGISLVDRVVEEMAERWSKGEGPLAEEFLDRYPELKSQPETAVRVIYEEFCLRQDHGKEIPPSEILGRFPQWREQLEVLLECDFLIKPSLEEPQIPSEGDSWLDFKLVSTLGRGAQGAVFLAVQPALEDRPVVLKITPCDGREHLSLARLQHTNIVPLYAAHDEESRNLRTLCMPYFGGASLADVLKEMRAIPVGCRTGQSILTALDHIQASLPIRITGRGPRQTLAQASYVQAVCLMGAGLAEGLQYAHDRGLIHLDIKPGNVLVAADAQTMLLDFHLAQEPIKPGQVLPPWLGGTPVYMSPEQALTLDALREGRLAPVAVDGRSDIYSLGLLLHETLGGSFPVDREARAPLRSNNRGVSVGLADLVHKCLARVPGERYQTAAALAEDLRRHIFDQPLRGVANRDPSERWAKWRRRKPLALYVWTALVASTFLAVLAGKIWWTNRIDQANRLEAQLEERLLESQTQLDRHQYEDALASLTRALELTYQLPDNHRLIRQVTDQRKAAYRLKLGEDLHQVTDQLRFLYGSETLKPKEMQTLVDACRGFWEERERIKELLTGDLTDVIRHRLHNDLFELGIMWADLGVRSAAKSEETAARRRALIVLDEVEKLFQAGPALLLIRQINAEALGMRDKAESARQAFNRTRAADVWEHLALGRLLLQVGPTQSLVEAAKHFRDAVGLQPQNFWANYYEGICAYRLQHYEEANRCLSACVSLAPDSKECKQNRELALSEVKKAQAKLRGKLAGNPEILQLLDMLEGS
ncbi:MAG: protein kinase domain-containing protein [Gemmataceae bacterium]